MEVNFGHVTSRYAASCDDIPHQFFDTLKVRGIVWEGRKVAEICNDYQITQAQYYQWREQFLSNLDKPFEAKKATTREERLKSENQKLKALIGGLTLELKKTEEELL